MEYINCPDAPAAIGPYSQAIKVENFLFVSGQIPLNPETGKILYSTIQETTELVLNNLIKIVKYSNFNVKDIVKITVYLKDISYFSEFNKTYKKFFKIHKPARVVVEVTNLPKEVNIEIDAICIKNK